MAQIDLRLSTLQQANGTHEILIRFYQGSKFNLRAKSGVSIEPDYFEYTINWAKTLKAGISMPKKMIRTSTLSNATKKGYVLNGAGDIVINEQRVLSNAVKREIQEKQNKIKLLKDFIMKSYESADKTDVKYNPQNEMFRHFRTKCSISQNETYLRESFSLPINQIKKHRKNLLLRCFFIACLFGYLAKIH